MKTSATYVLLLLLNVFCLPIVRADENRLDVAVLILAMNNPYWKTLHDGAIARAEKLGIDIFIQGTQLPDDAEGQLNLCNTMLLRKPRALVFAAVNDVNLAPCLREAARRGVKLADVDGGTSKEAAEKIGVPLEFSVASNNYELGKKAAKYLEGKTGKVLVIEGFSSSLPGRLRIQGFKENLPVGLEIIASLPGNWDRLKSADLTNGTIGKHPDLKVIFAANDTMALGAAEALLARNVKGVSVIGVDAITDAVKAIKEGRLTASIAQLPYLMGGDAVEKAYRLVNGQKYEFEQTVPILAIDQEVLGKNDEPLLQYLK